MGRKKILKEIKNDIIVEPQILPAADPEPEIESHPTITEIEQPTQQSHCLVESTTPIKLQLVNPEHMDSDTDTLIVASKRRSLTDKTKEALKKGL